MSSHQKASTGNSHSAFTSVAGIGGEQSPQFRPPSGSGTKRMSASAALSPNIFPQQTPAAFSNLMNQQSHPQSAAVRNSNAAAMYEYCLQMLRHRPSDAQQRVNLWQLYNQQLAAKTAAVAAVAAQGVNANPSAGTVNQVNQIPPPPSASTGAPIASYFQSNPLLAQFAMAQQHKAAAAVNNSNNNNGNSGISATTAPTLPLQSFISNKSEPNPAKSQIQPAVKEEVTPHSIASALCAASTVATNDTDKSSQKQERANNTSGNVPISSSQCDVCKNGSRHVCDTCQIIFTDEVMYTIHMGIHTKANPLQCNICGFLSSTRYEFASHVARGDHRPKETTTAATGTKSAESVCTAD